jgi:hypothetical protein
MTTREEKILAMTRNELVFLIDSPEWLDDTAKFFAGGGFNAYTDEQLDKQYKDAIHLCNFTISRPNELLYQIQPEQYLLYSADHQPQVYQCKGNNWSGLTITAGISILTVSDECNLNLTEHQITSQAYYQSTPVIEILPISSVYNRTRNYYIKTQNIIELVTCSILLFLSFIAAIRAIVNRVNRPRLLQLPL